jgi:hypothetical protein
VAQVVECLPSKYETLSSNSQYHQKKKKMYRRSGRRRRREGKEREKIEGPQI